ncbi:MAG TPA: non-canonical purine NTP pyrophosphatase, partial [Candidatus Baltobacteraceae bacterium]|nr:non-canonical purine NTP pyrophosphatase [Candidatus Baltobacteraceae bacterium]
MLAATKNRGKLRELQAILEPLGWTIEADPAYVDPPEGDRSYRENAAAKARALRAQLRERGLTVAVLGDDSGLEVAALGGRPGVLSARYGGETLDWRARRARLLSELGPQSERSARFVCALHLSDATGVELSVERDVRGTIASAERGEGGFSYDAIFTSEGESRTFAELSAEEKNARSHR